MDSCLSLCMISWRVAPWLKADALARCMPLAHAAFWCLVGLLVLLLLGRALAGRKTRTFGSAYRIFFLLVVALSAAILAYQASWQLAGFARPEFVTFMKRYNRRPDNPAARIVRGKIRDARGESLAEMDPDHPGRRRYPHGPAFCHIVGYEHPFYGMSGLELAEQDFLVGITRDSDSERDQFRRNLLNRDEIRGNDLTLTLQAALQEEAAALMKGRKGAVVVMDPSTGALLVFYSAPGFNPNRMAPGLFDGGDPDARLLNRAARGLYPAGSAGKILVAAAALEKGISPVMDCPPGGYRPNLSTRAIRDHEYYEYRKQGREWPGHGRLNMRDALAKSSNVYFSKLGVQVGGARLRAAAERCGLTRSWVIHEGPAGSLASAAARFPALSDDDIGRTAQVSIGQGDMLVTPLHMAMIAGAIGRNGSAWKPRLVAGTPAQALAPFFSPACARAVAGMMRNAVLHGTGRGADIPGLNVAGKTGTAQNPHGNDHAWFVGFAPSANPRLAFAVIVEQGGYGAQAAVPVARGILVKAQALGLAGEGPESKRK